MPTPNNDILVIGVHGFNTDGQYIKKLGFPFRSHGFGYYSFVYGKIFLTIIGNLIANRFRTKGVFNKLVQFINRKKRPQKIILVGHSHGLRLAWAVQKVLPDRVIGVIGINGALDDDKVFKNCWFINCYHPKDWVLKTAVWRIKSAWGDTGCKPVLHADYNLDLSKYYTSWNPHSQIFKGCNIQKVENELFAAVQSQLNFI